MAWLDHIVDSLLVDWKLTVFFHDLFVLKYADSPNQRDFFSRFNRSTNMLNQINRLRVTVKTFARRINFPGHTEC